METNTTTQGNNKVEKAAKREKVKVYAIKRFNEMVEQIVGTEVTTEEEDKYLVDLKVKIVQRYMGMEV